MRAMINHKEKYIGDSLYELDISNQLSSIFKQEIQVSFSNTNTNTKFVKKFYIEVNSDSTLRLLIPFNACAYMFNYLSPTRNISKALLRLLKILYGLRVLQYIRNFRVIEVSGLDNINWKKYCWVDSVAPDIFLIVGTPKKTQNAVVFLDSIKSNNGTLVLKSGLTKYSNLLNEFSSSKFIPQNKTKYLTYNSDEDFIVQQFQEGFRKVSLISENHIHYLSKMIRVSPKIAGNSTKKYLLDLLIKFQPANNLTIEKIHSLLKLLRTDVNFFSAYVHGDFAPYNMVYQIFPSKFFLIDWELSSEEGLALTDLFNYVYITDCLFGKKDSKNLDESLYSSAATYFKHINHDLSRDLFIQYKIYFIINEFLHRLDDAGDKDVYVQYLLNMIENEI